MTKKKGSDIVSKIPKSADKDSRAESLAKLQTQRILALQAGNTKAASLIEKVIQRLEDKKK